MRVVAGSVRVLEAQGRENCGHGMPVLLDKQMKVSERLCETSCYNCAKSLHCYLRPIASTLEITVLKAPAPIISISQILTSVRGGIRVMAQCCKSHLVNLVSFRCYTSVTVMIGDLVTTSGLNSLSCSVSVAPCLVTYSAGDEVSALCRPFGLAVLTQWGTAAWEAIKLGLEERFDNVCSLHHIALLASL